MRCRAPARPPSSCAPAQTAFHGSCFSRTTQLRTNACSDAGRPSRPQSGISFHAARSRRPRASTTGGGVMGGVVTSAGHTAISGGAGHAMAGGFGSGGDAHAASNRTQAMTDNRIRVLGLPRDCLRHWRSPSESSGGRFRKRRRKTTTSASAAQCRTRGTLSVNSGIEASKRVPSSATSW